MLTWFFLGPDRFQEIVDLNAVNVAVSDTKSLQVGLSYARAALGLMTSVTTAVRFPVQLTRVDGSRAGLVFVLSLMLKVVDFFPCLGRHPL